MTNQIPKEPSQQYLDRFKEYTVNPNTGQLFKGGKEIGHLRKQDGRYTVSVSAQCNFKQFLRSHIVWYLCKGYWPRLGLDHEDRNCSNDSITNLREKSQAFNTFNKKITSIKETDLPPGVHIYKNGKYLAKIGVAGKEIHLGYFDTLTEAIEIRKAAEIEYYGEEWK